MISIDRYTCIDSLCWCVISIDDLCLPISKTWHLFTLSQCRIKMVRTFDEINFQSVLVVVAATLKGQDSPRSKWNAHQRLQLPLYTSAYSDGLKVFICRCVSNTSFWIFLNLNMHNILLCHFMSLSTTPSSNIYYPSSTSLPLLDWTLDTPLELQFVHREHLPVV